jgi:hypothetical protein
MKPKFELLIAIIFLTNTIVYSQITEKEYIINKEMDTIFCQIIKIDNKNIEYKIENKEKTIKEKIKDLIDIKLLNYQVIENPLGIIIETPEEGYAHVYFYRPYIYTGSALNLKVEYNGNSFINLKTKSYYLHKVKANEIHYYNWIHNKDEKIEINAVSGKIYYIKGTFGSDEGFGQFMNLSNDLSLSIDNSKTAFIRVLTMEKLSLTY